MAKPNLPDAVAEDGAPTAQGSTQGANTEPTPATPVLTVHEDPPPPYCVVAHLPSTPLETPLVTPPFAGHPLATMTPVQAVQGMPEAAWRRSHLYLPLVASSSLSSQSASPGGSPCCSNCMATSSSATRPSCNHMVCEACTSASSTPTSETCTTCSTSRTASMTASSCANCRSCAATSAPSPTRPALALAWGGTVRNTESTVARDCNCNHTHSPVAITPVAISPAAPAALPSPVAVEGACVPGPLAGALPQLAPASDPVSDPAPARSPAGLTSAGAETAKPSVPSRQVSTVARNTLSSAVKLYGGLDSEGAFPPLSSFRMLTSWQKRLLVFSVVWTALIIVAGALGCYFIALGP